MQVYDMIEKIQLENLFRSIRLVSFCMGLELDILLSLPIQQAFTPPHISL